MERNVAFILLCIGQEPLMSFKWESGIDRTRSYSPFRAHSTETVPLKVTSDFHFAKSMDHFSVSFSLFFKVHHLTKSDTANCSLFLDRFLLAYYVTLSLFSSHHTGHSLLVRSLFHHWTSGHWSAPELFFSLFISSLGIPWLEITGIYARDP